MKERKEERKKHKFEFLITLLGMDQAYDQKLIAQNYTNFYGSQFLDDCCNTPASSQFNSSIISMPNNSNSPYVNKGKRKEKNENLKNSEKREYNIII